MLRAKLSENSRKAAKTRSSVAKEELEEMVQTLDQIISSNDKVWGYYLSAAVSGQDSGVDPAQPTTNFPLYGFSDIEYSNGYFEQEDLNIIAEGGIEIFTQQVAGAAFLSRHQMTTNTTLLTKQERSIVRAADWCSDFKQKNSSYLRYESFTKVVKEER